MDRKRPILRPILRPVLRPVLRGMLGHPSDNPDAAIAALFAGGAQGLWYKLRDFGTLFQDSAGTTPVTATGQPIGKIVDKSGNGNHATQATASYRPTLAGNYGLIGDFVDDFIALAAPCGASTAYINTPWGWYKSQIGGASGIPMGYATDIIVRDGLSGAQEATIAGVWGTSQVFEVQAKSATSIPANSIYIVTSGAAVPLLFVGANGTTATRNVSSGVYLPAEDLAASGLTAPVAAIWPASMIGSSQITFSRLASQNTSGSIPSLAANTALQQFHCHINQLTGSIPSLSANTALTYFYCNSNQLTGSIPSLSANTALQQFYCNSNQLTGSIPSLSANTALTYFYCNTNQLTGYAGGGVSATLGTFQALNNLLTQAAVDAILADFVAAGRTSASGTCVLNLGGTGNAAPSATGLGNKSTLAGRGWTVTTN